jgi:hypothetical protein
VLDGAGVIEFKQDENSGVLKVAKSAKWFGPVFLLVDIRRKRHKMSCGSGTGLFNTLKLSMR